MTGLGRVRVGLVGAGQISHFAAAELVRHPQVELWGVAEPHPVRREALADEFGIEARFERAAQMFATPGLDAVYIATPNVLHAELALSALRAGKHVLLEKPFATTAQDARTVLEAARTLGRTVGLCMNHRFSAGAQRLRSSVETGALGAVYHSRAFWFRRSGIPKLGTWFGKKELSGGGALLDIGVHLLDLALYTLDDFEPRAVSAATHSALGVQGLGEGGWGHSDSEAGGFDVEDFATALIHFKSGRTLSLDAAWALHQAEPEQHNLIHHGSRGAAGCYPAESYRYGEGQAYVVEPLGGPLRYPAQSPFFNFIDHLLGLEPLCVTPEQVLVVQRLLDAIYESARTGQQVTL